MRGILGCHLSPIWASDQTRKQLCCRCLGRRCWCKPGTAPTPPRFAPTPLRERVQLHRSHGVHQLGPATGRTRLRPAAPNTGPGGCGPRPPVHRGSLAVTQACTTSGRQSTRRCRHRCRGRQVGVHGSFHRNAPKRFTVSSAGPFRAPLSAMQPKSQGCRQAAPPGLPPAACGGQKSGF